jgi:ABC-2 type transport system permease protein
MNTWTGGLRLTRLAVRRDRVTVPAWILGLGAFVAATTALFEHDFVDVEDVVRETRLVATNAGMRMLGLVSGATVGGYMLHREYVMLAALAALMSTLLVVRHTRQNEELGRAEVLGSAVVGRKAALAAAVATGVAANVLLACVLGLAIVVAGQPVAGSFLAGASVASVGLVFVGVAAVSSQLASTTRGASGIAGGVLALAFLLSGVGNMLGSVDESGLTVDSAWPVWLSPIGWGQQVRPFGGDHAWPLVLSVLLCGALVVLAFALVGRRDIGRGLWREPEAPSAAPRSLLSPTGLAWRLQRGAVLGWALGMLGFGLVLGGITEQISTVGGGTAEWYTRTGGTDVVVDAFLTSIIGMAGMFVSIYAVQVLLRIRVDETGGTAESVLATGVTRPRWLVGHLAGTLAGAVLLLVVFGAAMGLAAGLVLGDGAIHLLEMTSAGLVQLPGVMVVGGAVTALVGVLPRAATALSWVLLVVALVVGPMFGPGLGLPAWVQDLSPFTHVPKYPATDPSAVPLLLLAGTGLALTLVGVLATRRRDLRLPV